MQRVKIPLKNFLDFIWHKCPSNEEVWWGFTLGFCFQTSFKGKVVMNMNAQVRKQTEKKNHSFLDENMGQKDANYFAVVHIM